MFQEKDIEAYQSIKAPVELKNRIRLSVELQRRKRRRQSVAVLSAAACFAIVLFAGGNLRNTSTIISVNDTAVSYEAVELGATSSYDIATANVGRSSKAFLQVPMEISVSEKAHICVSEGTIQTKVETDSLAKEITEMDVFENTVIYWQVTGDINSTPVCTIVTGGKEYVYVIEFDEKEAVYTIKQTK